MRTSVPIAHPRLLFVDDNDMLLDASRRALRRAHKTWEVQTLSNPFAAIELIAKIPFDIVTSDLWMPGMNGVDFLTAVAGSQPGAVRILMTGGSGPDPDVMPDGVFHYRLDKPCDARLLIETIERALKASRPDLHPQANAERRPE